MLEEETGWQVEEMVVEIEGKGETERNKEYTYTDACETETARDT